MHSLPSFKYGKGLNKVILIVASVSKTFALNVLEPWKPPWVRTAHQGPPLFCVWLFYLLRWLNFFLWQSNNNSRDLWQSHMGRQPGPPWQWHLVGSRWSAATVIWPCFVLWAWSSVPHPPWCCPPASWSQICSLTSPYIKHLNAEFALIKSCLWLSRHSLCSNRVAFNFKDFWVATVPWLRSKWVNSARQQGV